MRTEFPTVKGRNINHRISENLSQKELRIREEVFMQAIEIPYNPFLYPFMKSSRAPQPLSRVIT